MIDHFISSSLFYIADNKYTFLSVQNIFQDFKYLPLQAGSTWGPHATYICGILHLKSEWKIKW